jgi:hypothetical protein
MERREITQAEVDLLRFAAEHAHGFSVEEIIATYVKFRSALSVPYRRESHSEGAQKDSQESSGTL